MNTLTICGRLTRVSMLALLVAGISAPAMAQEDDEQEMRGERIVIELDEDGRVIVDGRRISDDDGPVVLRVRPEDGEVEVEHVGPGRSMRLFSSADNARPPHFVWRGDGPWHDLSDFEVHVDPPDMSAIAPLMKGMRFEMDGLHSSLEEHQEVAELERESRELAREARRADGAERAQREADFRATLEEIFDKKLELRRERLSELEENLEEERAALQERADAREDMIERRFRRLLGEGDMLEW